LPCVAVCCRVLPCVAVCCSVLQCVAVCCSVLQCVTVRGRMLQCVAVCCSVLQCVAVCCSLIYIHTSHHQQAQGIRRTRRQPPIVPCNVFVCERVCVVAFVESTNFTRLLPVVATDACTYMHAQTHTHVYVRTHECTYERTRTHVPAHTYTHS